MPAAETDLAAQAGEALQRLLRVVPPGDALSVLCHSDADGIAAGAILTRSLRRAGCDCACDVTRKGEDAWSPAVRERLQALRPAGLIVADLGSRAEPVLDGVPTLLIDHHRPTGIPPQAELLTGYGVEPTPTSGLLAYWCAQALGAADDLLWIAAISLLSDIGDKAPFAELEQARAKYKITPLRDATSLLNAPRRSATGYAGPALRLLLERNGPAEITKGAGPDIDALHAAKAEVGMALAEARKAAPKFSGKVALLQIDTPCQVHPLIAQQWRTRLPDYIVMCANHGYLPGRVNFSMRTKTSANLLEFLAQHRPEGAGEDYGRGHDQATGGSLPKDVWREFAERLGF